MLTLFCMLAMAGEHTGEEWFQIGWKEYTAVGVILLIWMIMVFTNKLPSMASFKDFADTINSAGGHIIILSIFSGWFFVSAMRFFFHSFSLPDEIITKHDALVMNAVSFLTGTAFGGAWGALIKTMSGGKANGPNGVPPANAPDTLTASLVPEKTDGLRVVEGK
jgi:hypothetical protein